MDLKLIGETIKKYREQNNIDREIMAAELNMTPNAYGRIERGEVDLSITKLDKIAALLKVRVSQILSVDAGQIFNISNTNNKVSIQGVNNNHNTDVFKDKYIEKLEKELEKYRGSKSNKSWLSCPFTSHPLRSSGVETRNCFFENWIKSSENTSWHWDTSFVHTPNRKNKLWKSQIQKIAAIFLKAGIF